MVEQQGTSIWSKFVSAVRRFCFFNLRQGKFNASSRLLYMFVYKATKIRWKIQITWKLLSWTSTTLHSLSFLEWPREVHGVFFLHYSQLICFDCTDNLYPIPSKSCHQLQLMGSAVSNLKFLYAEHRMSKAPGKKAHFRLSMSFKSSLVAASLACIIFNRARLNASDTEGEENDAHVILDYMHT